MRRGIGKRLSYAGAYNSLGTDDRHNDTANWDSTE